MKTLKNKHLISSKGSLLKGFVFLFVFCVSYNTAVFSQSPDSLSATAKTDSASVSAPAADDNSGPSLKNLSKTISAGDEKLREQARWNEILGYIEMVVGFAITVTLAWFLASWARKQELKKAEEKRIRVEKALIRKGFTVVSDVEKKEGDSSVALKPPPGHRPPTRRR